MKKDLRLW